MLVFILKKKKKIIIYIYIYNNIFLKYISTSKSFYISELIKKNFFKYIFYNMKNFYY